jgi:uncharacterized protein (DUF58 family)
MAAVTTTQRRVRLSREGWFYAIVLGFIVCGAVLREVNLLFILAAVMMGPLFLGWRVARGALGEISAFRHGPRRAHAGNLAPLELEITNGRGNSSSWMLVVRDSLVAPTGRVSIAALATSVDRLLGIAFFPHLPPHATRRSPYAWRPLVRGRHRLGPLVLSTKFPLGLVEASAKVDLPGELIVAPALGRLRRDWQRWLERVGEGAETASQRRGMREGDYYGLREWRPGDSRRWIHWRSSARQGSLTTLQFEDQRRDDVVMIVDPWVPTRPSSADLERVELALSFAATVVVELSRGSGRTLRVALGGSTPRHWNSTQGNSRDEILDALAELEAATNCDLAALGGRFLTAPASAGPSRQRLIVLSTRPQTSAPFATSPASVFANALWIEVGSSTFHDYFASPSEFARKSESPEELATASSGGATPDAQTVIPLKAKSAPRGGP